MNARFDSVLVANRGEIAVRVMRTAKDLGYRTVAVYSDADADALHVSVADTAVRLGPAPARDSYLRPDLIIAAARRSGAQAIHPGYGFLSENAEFAQACHDAGLVFIGPSPDSIRLMGDKAASKRWVAENGVPLLPGYQGEESDDARLMAEATAIGFPLMVKAAAGGGGKGMRLVQSPSELQDAITTARHEASNAFGSDVLILERAVTRPRHVEVQVLGDEHGNVISLGERDCSVQRRHQKVVEESPAPGLNDELRTAIAAAAVAAASSINYVGAGTVEFILDEDGRFAFLEMNTRLQVEHPVTELVTGQDLVEWQLRIAQGEALTITQSDVRMDGHAIEVRLYAEDPANDYLPATGSVHAWAPAHGVRVDAGIRAGSRVTPHYDPMLAKIIAHGRTRDEARRKLVHALRETTLLGVTTNRSFLIDVLTHPGFADATPTTAFLSENPMAAHEPTPTQLAIAAAALHQEAEKAAEIRSPGLAGWASTARRHSRRRLAVGDHVTNVTIERTRDGLVTEIDGRVSAVSFTPSGLTLIDEHLPYDATVVSSDRVLLRFADLDLDVRDVLFEPPASASAAGSGVLTAKMHGAVVSTHVEPATEVAVGDKLLVLEAMKMQMPVLADIAGRVEYIAQPGTQLSTGDIAARIVAHCTEQEGTPA